MQPLVDLVGRDAEVAALLEFIPACPLVTVTGVGGVGKTSLALRAAALLTASFPDGVRVCELPPELDPAAVPATVTSQLGLPSLDAAKTAFGDAAVLIVLDNCEHVLDAAAAVARALIDAGAGIRVLATSREPLAIQGERVVVVDTLAVPATDDVDDVRRSPAAQMLTDRATAAGAAATIDEATSAAIADVCRRLDGLPLALQLAAARCRTLTPAEIARHLDDRFRLLAARTVRGPQRHRSLRAAIDWSYDLLDDRERRFFDALGVFDDRFSAEAARHVAGLDDTPMLTVVARLDDLVQRSLVTVEQSLIGSRYRLLESLRDYARDRLAERGMLDSTRNRHLDHLADMAREVHEHSCATWEPQVFMRLFLEYESVRSATEWCIAHDGTPHRALMLFLPQWMTIDNAKPRVVADLGQRLLARWPATDDPARADAAAITAWALAVAGEAAGARQLAERTASAARHGFAAVAVCRLLCMLENAAGQPAAALRWAEEANTVARADGLAPFACELYAWRAQALYHLGRRDEALANALAMREEATRLPSTNLLVAAMLVHGNLFAGVDDATARTLLEDATDLAVEHQIPWGTGNGLRACGAAALIAGDAAAAAEPLLAALAAFASAGNEAEVWWTLRWIAVLLVQTGRGSTANRLLSTPPRQPPVMVMNMLEGRFLPRLLHRMHHTPPDGPVTLRDAIVLARTALAPEATPVSAAATPAVATDVPGHPLTGQPAAAGNRFTLDGEFWTLTFDGRTIRLRDTKGLRDIARLLERAGDEIHCLELMGAPAPGDAGPDTVERARSAVGWRIRAALKRIEDAHPALGHHLDRTIRTGTSCRYEPPGPVDWQGRAPSSTD